MKTLCVFMLLIGPLMADSGASVRIFVTSEDGERITTAQIKLVQTRSQKEQGQTLQDGVASNIPFGSYDLKVWKPGFRKFEQRLALFQKERDLRVVLAVIGGEQTGPLRLTGTVLLDRSKSDKAIWALAFPLAGSPENLQSIVDKDGHFRLETVDGGLYLLAVAQGSHVLECRMVYIGRDSQPVVIRPSGSACGNLVTEPVR